MAAGFDNPAHPNAMDTSEDFFVDQTQVTHDVNGPALVRSVQEPEVDQILTESSSKKRKSLSPVQDADASTGLDYESTGPSKRARRDGAASPESKISHFPDWSTLPAEVWHSILSACPPKTLGNLLRVNKLLNSYLDPASGAVLKEPLPPPAKSVLKPMEPNAIWRGARRRFWPTMPAPLSGKTELDMWRLCCSTACQFCGKQNARQASPPLDSFRVGPGGNGVACIWEFRIRCCGSCLLDRSLREMDLILSDTPTFLMPALPFVFISSNSCIVPLSTIERGLLPPSSTLTKLCWKADVEILRSEFSSVKELGASAVEEWQKGLSVRGSSKRAEASKWEKYAESGSIATMQAMLYPGYRLTPSSNEASQTAITPLLEEGGQPAAAHVTEAMTKAMAATETQEQPVLNQATHDAEGQKAKSSAVENKQSALASVQKNPTKKKTKEETDAEWDEIQGPVRLKILRYADEAIIGDWDEGERVTKDNAPSFAADVLIHVRKRFYAEVKKEAKAARASGKQPIVDPPNGPFTQKLSLENMKYVFDVKVKPITSKIRRELFLCNACGYNGKFFAFEAVVQHYAAKHTTSLSVGNVVVHWRLEWPMTPPFNPHPRPPKSSAHPLPALPPKPAAPRSAAPASSRSNRATTVYPAVVPPANPSQPPPGPTLQHPHQHQPFPGFSADTAVDVSHYVPELPQLPHLPQGSLQPVPSPYTTNHPVFQPPPSTFQELTPPAPHNPYYESTEIGAGFFPVATGPPLQHYAAPAPPAALHAAPPAPVHDAQEGGSSIVRLPFASNGNGHAPAVPSASYHIELRELAGQTANLRKAMTAMRDLPGAVRIFTLIYQANKFFQARFGKPLSLNNFLEGLLNRKEMRPIRNIVELPCKACYLGLGRVPPGEEDRRLFSFSDLAYHFQKHIDQDSTAMPTAAPPIDWMNDMLLLPQPAALADMVRRYGDRHPLLDEALGYPTGKPDRCKAPHGLPEASVVDMDGANRLESKVRPRQVEPKTAHEGQMQRTLSGGGKKKGKSNGQGGQAQKNNLATNKEKRQEEKERRQGNVIHAMWAADRTQTSQALKNPTAATSAQQKPKPANGRYANQRNDKTQKKASELAGISRHAHGQAIKQEESDGAERRRALRMPAPATSVPEARSSDLLGALEMHLTGSRAGRPPVAQEDPRLRHDVDGGGRADEHRKQVVAYQAPSSQQRPKMRPSGHMIDNKGMEAPLVRPPSPGSHPGGVGNAAARGQHLQNRPTHPSSGREYRGEEPTPVYVSQRAMYEHVPPRALSYQYGRTQLPNERNQTYADENGRPFAPSHHSGHEAYETYEVVRVVHPDGEYYERRPVQREPPRVDYRTAERYQGYAPYEEARQRPPMHRNPAEGQRGVAYDVVYEPVIGTPVYGEPGRERAPAPPAIPHAPSRAASGYYEEYDPRRPSSMPGPTTQDGRPMQQQVRYQ